MAKAERENTSKIHFDYYYGGEAEQFTFIRLPKVLFTDPHFSLLSSDAKILYGMMLDRMSLSIRNQWVDKENRVYIIFTLEDVMKVFSCSERKAGYLLKELDNKSGIGLIEKKRQGLGKPNLIYVKNFIATSIFQDDEEKTDNMETEKTNSLQMQSGNNVKSQSSNDLPIKKCKETTIKSGKNLPFKTGKELPTNNTNYNKTECSETINPSKASDQMKQKDVMDGIARYRKLIKKNIEYDLLKEKLSIGECDYLDEILELMVETISIPCDTIRIESKDVPYQLVKAKMLKINSMHVEYVIRCLEKTTSKIRNIKAYLITTLYNAPTTLNSYYRAEVNHDMHND